MLFSISKANNNGFGSPYMLVGEEDNVGLSYMGWGSNRRVDNVTKSLFTWLVHQ